MHRLSLGAGLVLALTAPLSAMADTAADVAALRQEIDALRTSYEARLRALEQRLQAAEKAVAAPGATQPASQASAASSVAAPPVAAAPVAAPAAPTGGNAFNPAISLLLSGIYTRTSNDPAGYAITGVPLPPDAEIGPGTRGFSLAESELALSASIDPWFRGAAYVALQPDNTASIEEAFVRTTALGHGLSLKAGRFFSGVGYLNPKHAHTWDFVDNPLAYQAYLGTQYGDDGVQLTWIAPIDQYLEIGAEIGRGHSFPGSDTGRNGSGMTALTGHTGGDIGESHSWRAGLSVLNAKASDQDLALNGARGTAPGGIFNGSTRVLIADAVWKWAPDGNATRTSFKLQGEYLRSTRSGNLAYDLDNAGINGPYRAVQSGWYLQGVYQFMARWRVGLRTEELDAGAPDQAPGAGSPSADTYRPRKNSMMVDFSPSEFSRLRLQFAQDRARQGFTDRQVFLQYQMSLGAHGAHGY